MYVQSIDIKNLGAIESFDFNFNFDMNGNPTPMILVGKNGSGKTLAIVNILDSLIELKSNSFNEILEVKKGKLYKKSSQNYIRTGKSYSNVSINFKSSIFPNINYIDFMTNNIQLAKQELAANILRERLDWRIIESEEGFYKNITVSNCNDEFQKNVFLYFPVHRYYEPSWINRENDTNVEFNRDIKVIGRNKESIIQEDILKNIESWLLDVLLDKYIFELDKKINKYIDEKTQTEVYKEELIYQGKNSDIINRINRLLTVIYKTKFDDIEYTRIGVSRKDYGRTISIIIKRKDMEEYNISPTFFHLSSGEAMMIAMFLSILKAQDSKGIDVPMNEIEGIVIIDEIDMHLHIALAKNVLPLLMKEFPKIQFIVSSHSPFFLLGMQETYKESWDMVDMHKGTKVELESQEEIKEAYQTFVEGFETLQNNLASLENRIASVQKTLIITEGKTDWKHIKHALRCFQEKGGFTELDVDFWGYEDIDMGEGALDSLLKENSKLRKPHKIIGIFDRDAPKGRAFASERYKYLNNNVYGFSIPVPEFRSYHQGICIEMLYDDTILNKTNKEGRKIYLSSEFDERTARHKENKNIIVTNLEKYLKGKTDRSKETILSDGVIDEEGNSLVLSKNDFANSILHNEEPFNDIDYEGFRGLFEVLLEIEKLPLNY